MATTGTVDYCCLFVNDTAASCKGTTNTAKHCRSYETHYPTLITRKFLASPGWRGVVGLLSPAHTVTAHELDEFSRSVTRLLPLFCRQISDITSLPVHAHPASLLSLQTTAAAAASTQLLYMWVARVS